MNMGISNVQSKLFISLMLFAVLVSTFLLLGIITSTNRAMKFMIYYRRLLSAHIAMMLGEIGIWAFGGMPEYAAIMKICCILSIGGGALLNTMFVACICGILEETTKISYRLVHWMTAGSFVIGILAIASAFNGSLYAINEAGFYTDGPYYGIISLFDWLYLFTGMGMVVWYRKLLGKRTALSLLLYFLLLFASMLLPYRWYPVPQYLAVTLALILIYIVFFEDLAKKMADNEKKLAESRIAVTLSQVQPHFLYNTLATISELCERDPMLASRVTNSFAKYLRTNLDTLQCTSPIPFSEEIEHVKTYLQLEKLRFGEELHVEYDIREKNFELPPLSLQPLAENAIKHGMMGREGVFTIRICSEKKEKYYEIRVIDDGVGFDPKEEKRDARSHVGISNVRKILSLMVEGTLLVDSRPGKGTCVTIQIPIKKEGVRG